jgi:hypothetical protein
VLLFVKHRSPAKGPTFDSTGDTEAAMALVHPLHGDMAYERTSSHRGGDLIGVLARANKNDRVARENGRATTVVERSFV